MPVHKVNVKWGKEKLSDVELNTDEPPLVFKAQLFALCGVQPERQKLMFKGSVIKDDDWGMIKVKDGVMLLLMGTADALPSAPQDRPMFMEDMSEQQLASALDMPAGLTNLGNTCYMNATVQCLRAVPELREALKKYSGGFTVGGTIAPADSITAALRDLYTAMNDTSAAIPPIIFLQVLHMAFPRFAEKGEGGGYVQQDANECWVEIVRSLQQKLTAVGAGTEEVQGSTTSSFIDQYFGGEFESEMKCTEAPEEEATKSREKFLQLSCFIDQDVKYMHTGLKNRLEESITKNSPTLGRDAVYSKSSKLRRIPGYLTIQFVRFCYKEAKAVNAKLLRDVKFPMALDVFDLCSPELQQKLIPMRDRFKEEDDKRIEEAQMQAGKTDKQDIKKQLKALPYYFPDDPGSNNSGFYELSAVLTHKGRSSSSGHYVAWVRKKGDNWLMFDDDKVMPVSGEDVLKLSGGGDWHVAYVLLYAPRVLEVDPES
ncbi:ubiquitin carboxyl-terminal hydrolase 14-like isoform X1 [Pomacea canaliculata]|uniref:ubiquitin carboxyl-terminal hydrolase 14-like isoform X1 n=1 Tax=Pomacea canaliculata TaxID=400727 RepID=UPI000D72C599|nr:ubiquitin carboxyl-terminal hydrolase 14-like isoform X1 [Pomacea canaliculata]